MNKQELTAKYPNITKFLIGLFLDNVPLPLERWEPNFTSDYIDWDKLEQEATRVIGANTIWDGSFYDGYTDAEKLVFGTEEGTEEAYEKLQEKYNAQYLAKFLDECFQGELAEQFCSI